jgi:hypothetical protein
MNEISRRSVTFGVENGQALKGERAMIQKTSFLIAVIGVLLLAAVLPAHSVAYADGQNPMPDNANCISCHEDLYFLHDTGNWFCLKESPMSCVNCHGGDPLAGTKELAHANRAAHPVLNDDISKCQECHPDECTERMQIFDQTAGISEVLVALPYSPALVPVTGQSQDKPEIDLMERINKISLMEMLTPVLLIGIAMMVYIIHRKHQNRITK